MTEPTSAQADAIVVGAGISGLVACCELIDAGRTVLLLDAEPEASLGGQAWWSFGGLMLINSAEQRRLRVHDSEELAWQDWQGSAAFDRDTDYWPRQWARAYVHFAAGEKRSWLAERGLSWFPLVQWAERGGYGPLGHGNSVPRFHVTWGTGPGVVDPFIARVRAGVEQGLVRLRFRHRVTGLITEAGTVTGVRGELLEQSSVGRGEPSSRRAVGEFSFAAQAVLVTAGGIGANHDKVRQNWPARHPPVRADSTASGNAVPAAARGRHAAEVSTAPSYLLSGVPDHVDGSMQEVIAAAGGRLINDDRMWHYPEGVRNPEPVWTRHGIRILPGPSALWLDAAGNRLPAPLFPGFDALGALEHITATGHEHSWFVLNHQIMSNEFALSGSEQNPDLTSGSRREVAKRRLSKEPTHLQRFADRCEDFVFADHVAGLASKMNALTDAPLIDAGALQRLIAARDAEVDSRLGKDPQLMAIFAARRFFTDRIMRATKPHRLTDRSAGPLVAVRLSVLTRKSLGGALTDLSARVLDDAGDAVPGLYAAGESAGFGGGGLHGYRALEGTFLGGCIFSGRTAGRAIAVALG